MIVRELVTRLGFQVNEGQLRRYEQGTQNIRQSANAAADSFKNMFLAFAGFSAIKSIAKTADEMQSMQARIGMLPQTVTESADAFDVVAARASVARQSIEAYGSFYIKLQNAGKDFIKTQEEGLQVTDTITKALVVGGATAQEQSSALLQFGQAIGSGVFQGDEFRAMAEAAPQFMDELAKALGHPRTELKKLASEGKLTAKEIINATKKMAVVFDEKFKNMPMTIGQSMTIIGNRWDVFINHLNNKSLAVTKIANFFLKTFDSIEKGLSDMVDFFGGATNTLKFFGMALAAALAPLVFKTAAGAIAFLLSPIGLLITGLLALMLVGEDLYQWMNGGNSVIGKFIEGFTLFDSIKENFFILKDAVMNAFDSRVLTKFIGVVTALASYLMKVIPFKQILIGIGLMVNGIITVLTGIINIIAGVFKVVVGILTGDWAMFYEGIKQVFSGLIDFVLGIIEFVFGAFRQSLVFLGTLFRIMFDTMKTFIVDTIFGGIVDAAKRGWEFLKSLFGIGVSANVNANTPAVTPAVAAGAASSAGGVQAPANNAPTANVNVYQTLPPGTTAETAAAASDATTNAIRAAGLESLARQMGQTQ